MRVDPHAVVHSIGALAGLDLTGDAGTGVHRAVDAARQLLHADTARLLLADATGQLRWATAVSRQAETITDTGQQLAAGPCVAAFDDDRPVAVWDVTNDERWAPMRPELLAAGIAASLSVPIDLAGGPVGVLDLYCATPQPWDDSQIAAASTFAGVLSLLLMATLTAADASDLAAQLQHALTARVQIEQAKGVLMSREGLSERAAWERLRRAARNTQRPVGLVARDLIAELNPGSDPTGRTG